MADRLASPNEVSASSSEDKKEVLSPESYRFLLSVIKSEGLTDSLDSEIEKRKSIEERSGNRDYLIEQWMETIGDPSSSDPPFDEVAEESIEEPYGNRDCLTEQRIETLGDASPSDPPAAEGSAERQKRSDAAEKRKRKSDVKKEGLVIKMQPPDDDKENLSENKPPVESSPGSTAKGGRYVQAFRKAKEFLIDVKKELFFTNPDAYKRFLDIFEESKENREDLTDRLRVVAEAQDVIGHREDLMQRLVELAMSDLPADKPSRPLRPLVAADDRCVKRRSRDCKMKD